MYSVGKAEEMIRNSEYEKAKKMMESTDQLCERYGAPPPVHGLALRILADAYEQSARTEGTSDTDKKQGIEMREKLFTKRFRFVRATFWRQRVTEVVGERFERQSRGFTRRARGVA